MEDKNLGLNTAVEKCVLAAIASLHNLLYVVYTYPPQVSFSEVYQAAINILQVHPEDRLKLFNQTCIHFINHCRKLGVNDKEELSGKSVACKV